MSEKPTQALSHTVTIDLLIPLDNGISKIVMRRPKVRDLRAFNKIMGDEADKELGLFCNLCEQSPDVLDSLDMADYGALQETYKSFLLSRKKTSESAASS
jgi:hypothetical protein